MLHNHSYSLQPTRRVRVVHTGKPHPLLNKSRCTCHRIRPQAAMGWGVALLGAGGAAVASIAWMASRHLADGPGDDATGEERRAKLEQVADGLGSKAFAGLPEMTADKLHSLLNDPSSKVVLVDVRTPEEQKVSMIPGHQVITATEYEQDPDRWKGYQVVCNCTVGYRSGVYARKLRAAAPSGGAGEGIEAFNLRGGILAYTHAGLPLVDPSSGTETQRVHCFAPRWALHADGYTPVVFERPLVTMAQDSLRQMFGRRKAD